MTTKFNFALDAEATEFCRQIIEQMHQRHSVSEERAIKMMNRLWSGDDFEQFDLRYHNTVEKWADRLYEECNHRID